MNSDVPYVWAVLSISDVGFRFGTISSVGTVTWQFPLTGKRLQSKDCNPSTKYCSLSMVDFELCRFPRMPALGTVYVVRIWNGLDSIAGGRTWETMSQAETMTCGPMVSNPLDPRRKGQDPCEESPRQREDLPFQAFLDPPVVGNDVSSRSCKTQLQQTAARRRRIPELRRIA